MPSNQMEPGLVIMVIGLNLLLKGDMMMYHKIFREVLSVKMITVPLLPIKVKNVFSSERMDWIFLDTTVFQAIGLPILLEMVTMPTTELNGRRTESSQSFGNNGDDELDVYVNDRGFSQGLSDDSSAARSSVGAAS